MSNQVTQKERPKFSVAIKSDAYQKLIQQTLGDKEKTVRFTAAIMSAVAVSPSLQSCTPGSVLTGALLGEALELAHSPQMGHYYLVPYNTKEQGKVAQFQMGYKGYIQLAIRSGQYQRLNVVAVKEGELVSFNPFEEELEFSYITDPVKREKAQTIGYYASFKLNNGFEKTIYWSREQMLSHAKKYSKGFSGKTADSFWHKDFDSMAFKTMLRQLISKWGIMTIDMKSAFERDMGIANEDGTILYVDNPNEDGKGKKTGSARFEEDIVVDVEEDIDQDGVQEQTLGLDDV